MMVDSASLYFQSGSSDKEYHVYLEQSGEGYVVHFAFRRRGSTLQTGAKTLQPVTLERAKSIFDKLVAAKAAKGYTPGPSGTPYQETKNEARVTGILPQLLNPVDEVEAVILLADDRFWAQEKFDGRRVLIRKKDGEVTGINRNGLCIPLPAPVAQAVAAVDTDFVMDGECVGDEYFAFDLLQAVAHDLRGCQYSERLRTLEKLLSDSSSANLRLAQTARSKQEKGALLAVVRRSNGEGVVFKDHSAPYVSGRPASCGSQLKFKLVTTASFIVSKVNAKRSVALELIDDAGKRIGVGNVTIPPNQKNPGVGDIVEISYLYCFPNGGSLFQPVYLGRRDDIEASACTTSQLKIRPSKRGGDDDAE
jgi:bifunctional non-homologous end joining protein LigD